MNVVLINQFFPPAGAPTGRLLHSLAEALLTRGHRVTVIASAADYGSEAAGEGCISSGIQVVRVGPSGAHPSSLIRKMEGYLSFFRQAKRTLAQLPERPDVVVCMTTPPYSGHIGYQFWKSQGVPYLLWCMDLYPEALVAHGLVHRWNPLLPLLTRAARRERRHASGVISLGPDMTRRLEASGASPVAEIPVWNDFNLSPLLREEAHALRRQRGWGEEEIILLYSGNMGRAHRIDEFIQLAERLKNAPTPSRLVFSGRGPQRPVWEQQARGLIEFMPPVPDAHCTAHLLAADIHLVSQQPEWMGVVVPSKFQAACALGRPVVFAGPESSSVGIWIQESDSGWVLPPGKDSAIDAAIGGLRDEAVRVKKGQQAYGLYQQRFTREAQCAKVIERIEQAAKERK